MRRGAYIASPGNAATPHGRVLHKLQLFFEVVKFEHTVFAMPFAYIGMLLAAGGLPTWRQFLWITVAMVAARTLAMSANRLLQRREDAANPRTARRAVPTGRVRVWEVAALALGSLAVFLAAAAQLNRLALYLAPVAAVAVVGYSYVKYWSWLTHFVLGWADAIAPAGGWIAVRGSVSGEPVLLAFAVATWIGGFDVLYACQDVEFDKRYGVHSIPRRFGIAGALWWARGMHAAAAVALLALALWMGLAWPYYFGWAVSAALLVYEHRLVKPHDLSRLDTAFFNVNGYVAIVMFLATLGAMYA